MLRNKPGQDNGLGCAGLGMAYAADVHRRMANHFTRKYADLEADGFEAETESPSDSTGKKYRLCDFAIVDRNQGSNFDKVVLAIEICHSGNYKQAVERVADIMQNNNNPECFVFRYDTGSWEKHYSDGKIAETSWSAFLDADIMTGSRRYYSKVLRESKDL